MSTRICGIGPRWLKSWCSQLCESCVLCNRITCPLSCCCTVLTWSVSTHFGFPFSVITSAQFFIQLLFLFSCGIVPYSVYLVLTMFVYCICEILNKGFYNFSLHYSHIVCGQNVLDTAVNFKYLCIKFEKTFTVLILFSITYGQILVLILFVKEVVFVYNIFAWLIMKNF